MRRPFELPEALAVGSQLAVLTSEKFVALLCYEREAREYHRTLLREAMLSEFEAIELLSVEQG